jgi:hypothetical protein
MCRWRLEGFRELETPVEYQIEYGWTGQLGTQKMVAGARKASGRRDRRWCTKTNVYNVIRRISVRYE